MLLRSQAAELEEAAELINPVRVAAYLNSLATARGRGPCAMSDWHEEIQVYSSTKERVRYFWNASTGAQQYEVPNTYVPISLNATPGTASRIDADHHLPGAEDPSSSAFAF